MHNFLIINPDQWRADYAGCYGHPLVKTPNLDRLAAEGTRFNQCHVQHTVCSPSRCSFMTGWYPHVRGHRTLTHLLQPSEPNLLKTLKRSGYEVAWFGKNDLLAQESFADSVDFYDDYTGFLPPDVQNVFKDPDDPGYYSFLYEPTPRTIDEHVDALKVNAGIEFLKRPHDKPFCLYLPLVVPHCPFTAPQPYHDMYDPADIPPLRPAMLEGKPEFYRRIHEFYGLDKAPEWVWSKLNAVYLGTITMIDELIGRLLQTLEEQGLAENTTVLVHSDHGEWAGDYGLVEKWSSGLDDCLTRVPLVIRTPGGKAGHVVEEPVELFDQMATILDIADVDPGYTHFAQSLKPQLHGEPGDPERAVFAEGGAGLHEPHVLESSNGVPPRDQIYWGKIALQAEEPRINTRSVMIRTLTHKLVLRPETGDNELYDLQSDPQELKNVYDHPDHATIQTKLRDRLLNWSITTADITPPETDSRGMPETSRYWRRLGINEQ
jgi:choline-sulfatase